MPNADENDLREFAERVLRGAGLAPDDAGVAAECLVFANLRGVDGHGVLRLVQYADTIASGGVNPRPEVRVVSRRGATALVDADGGYGFRPTTLAVDEAVELSRANGIGFVGVRASHHFGMAATYVLRAAAAGRIGVVTTNSFPVLATPGATRPVVGNNPYAFAVPRRPPAEPIVLDMALSEVAFGRIRLAAAEGRPIPLGWARDEAGDPTEDSAAALRAGSLEPIGRHKGYGLAVIAEILAGALTGSPFGADSDAHGRREGGVGHVVIALDPAAFIPEESFHAAVDALAGQIAAVPPADGSEGALLPGELELRTLRERRAGGIPLSDELAAQLSRLATRLGAGRPPWPDH